MTNKQKEIRRKRAREWNKANYERKMLNQRAWREKNRGYIRQKAKEYAMTHREQSIQSQNKFHKTNPWYNHFLIARYRCRSPKSNRYKNYGGRGIKFSLSLDEIKWLWYRDKADSLKRPSIDRIDNDGDYKLGNCRFIELSENSARKKTKIATLL